jgi:hypothetical protein
MVVHSLGSVATPALDVVLKNSSGVIVARSRVGVIAPPNDLFPRTAEILLALSDDRDLTGYAIEIDPEHAVQEITTRNNIVRW